MMVITQEKQRECREIFDLFDKNKDGTISIEEIGDVMRGLGACPTQAEVQELLEQVDQDGSGKIEFKEFLELYSRNMKDPETEEELIEAFRIFDRDGNGQISVEELKHILTTMGEKMSDKDVIEILKEADLDGDQFISYKEFVKIMNNKTV